MQQISIPHANKREKEVQIKKKKTRKLTLIKVFFDSVRLTLNCVSYMMTLKREKHQETLLKK